MWERLKAFVSGWGWDQVSCAATTTPPCPHVNVLPLLSLSFSLRGRVSPSRCLVVSD